MWTERTKNGRYKFVERYTDPHTLEIRRISVVLDKNTPQAEKLARMRLQEKLDGILITAANIPDQTLKQLADAYAEHQATAVKASTAVRNKFAIKTILGLLGANTLASTLTAAFIRKRFLASGKSPSTLNEHLARLKAWLRWCYQVDLIANISYLDKLPLFPDKSHRAKIADKYLEPNELQLVLNDMHQRGHMGHYYMTKLLATTGMRIGEAIALLLTDIDYKEKVIHITKTYDVVNELVTDPKTLASTRDIPLNDTQIKMIKEIEQYHRLLTKAIPISGRLLFSTPAGSHVSHAAYNAMLKDTIQRVGIDKHITPHALRHTYASLMLANGLSVDTISRLLGHENSKITREIYLHTTEQLKQNDFEAARRISLL